MQTAQLLELLASRQRGGTSDSSDLLARVQAVGGGGQTLRDTLSRLAQTNPMIGLLAQQWGLAPSALSHPASIVDGESTVVSACEEGSSTPRVDAQPDVAVETHELYRAQMQQELAELTLYRDRTDRCAAALGACSLCWGTDGACRACRGRGQPGFSVPDAALFEEMILPAVRMIKAHRAVSAGLAPTSAAQSNEHVTPAGLSHPST